MTRRFRTGRSATNGTLTPRPYVSPLSLSSPPIPAGAPSYHSVPLSPGSQKKANEWQGQKVADSIGARAYFETSALLNRGVDSVFESATRAAVLVRDQGHGGVGAQFDRSGNERRDSYRPNQKEGRCCVIA